MDIGRKIKTIRVEKLMTQKELSGELITRNMLSQIENGVAQPSLSTVSYLAERLGVPADTFCLRAKRNLSTIKQE